MRLGPAKALRVLLLASSTVSAGHGVGQLQARGPSAGLVDHPDALTGLTGSVGSARCRSAWWRGSLRCRSVTPSTRTRTMGPGHCPLVGEARTVIGSCWSFAAGHCAQRRAGGEQVLCGRRGVDAVEGTRPLPASKLMPPAGLQHRGAGYQVVYAQGCGWCCRQCRHWQRRHRPGCSRRAGVAKTILRRGGRHLGRADRPGHRRERPSAPTPPVAGALGARSGGQ